MATSLVRIRRNKDKIIQDCDIYIGKKANKGGWKLKESIFANPFSEKKFGKEKAINYYRNHLEYRLYHEEDFREELAKLKGKKLGCFCEGRCHGEVLIEMIEKLID